MAGILNTVYSLAVLVVALLGIVYVLGLAGEEDESRSWWAWGVVIVVAVFLLAQVGMLLMT
jgi:NADH:ubiquinone oxidoreductase subunit 6 (subunit J)